jgi:D-amino-acid dehydrogenase
MHIIVLGAGIIGLTTAWTLRQDGHRVTVIDRNRAVGEGASFANGAQLSYSYVAPMAAPGVLASLPKWLLSKDSPVRYVPSADPGQIAWLLRFLAACTDATSAANTAKLLRLSQLSRDRLHAMIAATGIDFQHRRNGKLVIQSTDASQAAAMAQAEAALGLVFALDPAPALPSPRSPALADDAGAWTTAIDTLLEDPETLARMSRSAAGRMARRHTRDHRAAAR